MLLNAIFDNEVAISSNTAYVEVVTEAYQFTTTSDSQDVRIDINIPFSVHASAANPSNGGFRIYLDGDAVTAADGHQWNGTLICNGGAWAINDRVPTDGRVSYGGFITVPTAGTHTIFVNYSGSTTVIIGTLRSRRTIQVA
jgi:hypothetical protein